VARANAASDPLAAAKATQAGAVADRDAINADSKSTPAQRVSAQTAVVSANAGVVAAQNAAVQAQYDLNIALSNAGGDPVAAAAQNVAKLQAAIGALRAAGSPANGQALLSSQAQLVSAQASYVQTQISTAESLIQTDISLHRITIGGAIERLRQLKQLATNQTEMDQIQLQIQQLESQAGANLGFNISNINLPSLYEVRRLNATPAGTGYSDNRTISIQLNVNNQLDLSSATDMLAQTVGVSSSRFGVAGSTR
jgi:hypothetical protein